MFYLCIKPNSLFMMPWRSTRWLYYLYTAAAERWWCSRFPTRSGDFRQQLVIHKV